jgi:fructose-1-phosphate kinase PfkB-like protein
LALALKAEPSFFKVNLFEFSEACGKSFRDLSGVLRVLPIFCRHGLAHGVVTDGAKGALLWEEGEVLRVRSSSTAKGGMVVGAGDAFLAGYLKAWSEGRGLTERALLACAAGAVVARHGIAGFKPGRVSAELKKVKAERLKAI